MQTLPAHEIKRRGLAAIEELLANGPVHILKRNRPACVVLSETEYARLVPPASGTARPSAWEQLLAPAGSGGGDRADADARLDRERDGWS
jgi:hypothetical protein